MQRKRDISNVALKGTGHRLVYIEEKRKPMQSIYSSLGEKKKEKITNIRQCGVGDRFGRRDDEFCFKARYRKRGGDWG